MAVPTGRDAGRVWRPPVSRVERARPASDKFGRLGHLAPHRQGPPSPVPVNVHESFGQSKEAVAAAARAVEGVSECAPHPAHAPINISRMPLN